MRFGQIAVGSTILLMAACGGKQSLGENTGGQAGAEQGGTDTGGTTTAGTGGTTTAGGTGGKATGGATTGGSTGTAGAQPSCVDPTLHSRFILFDWDAGRLERKIYASRADGSELQAITNDSELAREPALSPDGTQLAYVADVGTIKLRDLVTGTTRAIASGDQPTFSPDGTELAYHSGKGVLILDLESETSESLISCAECSIAGFENPEFLPDGKSMIVDRENEIDFVNLATGESRDVVKNWTLLMSHPTAAGNGRFVASALECDGSDFSIWVSATDLTVEPCTARRLTAPGVLANTPKWGPENWILYERGSNPRDIALIDIDTSAECVLKLTGDDRNPIWAPEGFSLP